MKQTALVLLLACSACIESSPSELTRAALSCEFGAAISLAVGEVVHDSGGGARFCVEARDAATYLLLPFIAGARDTAARVIVGVYGGGLTTVPALPELQGVAAGRAPLGASALDRIIRSNDSWHDALRRREDTELRPRLRAGTGTSRTAAPAARLRNAHVPVPGDLIELNVAASCDRIERRQARVVAVTNQAIVAYDPANPTQDPFTEQDLQRFGQEFDQFVEPTITQHFGSETDLDQNGRVILFFTRAVNAVVPPGGGIGIAIGFFFRGDMFPRAGIPGRTEPCAGSNEGEVLFLAVPDPEGEVRGVPVNYATLNQVTTGTIAHEFQHLINTGRRLHVSNAPVLEETWLNEGLSHIAEELMFYAYTGLTPRQNVDTTAVLASNVRRNAFSRFVYSNLGRFDIYIQAPHDGSLMGVDGSSTRGAAWSFLRYAADRDARPDAVFFRALVDAPLAGTENLRAALGQDPVEWMKDWSVSVFADDIVPGDPRFQQPSWNLRNLITSLRVVDQRYPLGLLAVAPNGPGFSLRLRTGAAAYPVFAVQPGQRALIVLSAEGETSERAVHTVLMRVK